MNGYLLRMAESVRNPGGSIHPLLVPTPLPAPFQIGEEAPAQNVVRAREPQRSVLAPLPDVAPVESERVTPEPSVRIDRLAPPVSHTELQRATGPEHVSDTAPQEPTRVERSFFQPLVSPTQPIEAATASPAPTNAISGEDNFRPPTPSAKSDVLSRPTAAWAPVNPGRSHSRDAISDVAAPLEAPQRAGEQQNVREVSYRDRYQPLVAEMTPRTEPRIEQVSAKPSTASVRKAEASREPQRQPDEIQIHIGRIEVVAVPPAPVRVETKPANKSPNLGDYLKLRHGRF